MKSQSEHLKQEITDYEKELKKLQGELAAVTRNNTPTQANSPSGIASAIRAAAVETHERAVDVQGLRDAIAALQTGLGQKQQQLADLVKQQQRQQAEERSNKGLKILREIAVEVESLGQQLQQCFYKAKAISNEYSSDSRLARNLSPQHFNAYSDVLDTTGLICTPTLSETGGRFFIGLDTLDLMAMEKEQARLAEAQKFSAIARESEAAVQRQQEQAAAIHAASERERLNSLLRIKRDELSVAEDTRASWKTHGGNMNFDRVDALISRLEAEIREAEADLAVLGKDAA